MRLQGDGLRLQTGPVVTNIRSPLLAVQEGIALHYAMHGVEADDGFADFHVTVERPRGARRWRRPEAAFRFDGAAGVSPRPGDTGFATLEWGLDWCVSIHSNQYLIVRAAVLERGGRALLMPAPSGAGKSTLCAGLVFAGGWRLLSDELALIDPATGRVYPLPRPLALKNASIGAARQIAPAAHFGIEVAAPVIGRMLHVRPPADSVLRAAETALPAWVIAPNYAAGATARLEPLPKAQAFTRLVDNAFNYKLHGRRGFVGLADLVDACICRQIFYCDLPEAINLLEGLSTTET